MFWSKNVLTQYSLGENTDGEFRTWSFYNLDPFDPILTSNMTSDTAKYKMILTLPRLRTLPRLGFDRTWWYFSENWRPTSRDVIRVTGRKYSFFQKKILTILGKSRSLVPSFAVIWKLSTMIRSCGHFGPPSLGRVKWCFNVNKWLESVRIS